MFIDEKPEDALDFISGKRLRCSSPGPNSGIE
jgi:hypothetical protein